MFSGTVAGPALRVSTMRAWVQEVIGVEPVFGGKGEKIRHDLAQRYAFKIFQRLAKPYDAKCRAEVDYIATQFALGFIPRWIMLGRIYQVAGAPWYVYEFDLARLTLTGLLLYAADKIKL